MVPVMIHTIPVGFTNCFLVKQKGVILIDTGVPNKVSSIQKYFKKAGIDIKETSLIIHTHGHWDHIGNTQILVKETGVKTALHQSEKSCLEDGTILIPPGVTRWGRFLGHFSQMTSERVKIKTAKVDILIDDKGFDLSEYGIEGKVVYTPGHSSGSVSVVLDSGEAFVGDMAMNGFPFRKDPGLPIFAEDMTLLKKSWEKLIEMGVKTVFPAHGKPFSIEKIKV
jgi:glyoxylase-like metal-dependent hydrolase (beta-lactamase superfamily II)